MFFTLLATITAKALYSTSQRNYSHEPILLMNNKINLTNDSKLLMSNDSQYWFESVWQILYCLLNYQIIYVLYGYTVMAKNIGTLGKYDQRRL